uniref:Uncharacterized protein n=1 Tax=Rhizophora mucronata TaxID=61149 RepID=A0A2P2N0U1_RHIMU
MSKTQEKPIRNSSRK